MSAINDALKGIKQLLTMQLQIEALEDAAKVQRSDFKALAIDLIALDKRVVRIETMVEMSTGRGSQQPRIEG
jgi:hypothetical protein